MSAGFPGDNGIIDGEFTFGDPETGMAVITPQPVGGPGIASRPEYHTARTVGRPRDMERSKVALLREANIAGESFFYGWGAGDAHIEGASIDLAMAGLRCWGNCAQEMMPVQETRDSWIFTARVIDLETGFTTERQFRQGKKTIVHGKHDDARKEDIRFQIGQSKAIRNAALNFLPSWYTDAAVQVAKNGVRTRVEEFIKREGIVKAVDLALSGLEKVGAPTANVLNKLGYASKTAITVDDVVRLRADYTAIHMGQERAESLFPPAATEPAPGEVKKPEAKRTLDDVASDPNTPTSYVPKATPKIEPPTAPKEQEAAPPPTRKPREKAADKHKEAEQPPDRRRVVEDFAEQIRKATTETEVRGLITRLGLLMPPASHEQRDQIVDLAMNREAELKAPPESPKSTEAPASVESPAAAGPFDASTDPIVKEYTQFLNMATTEPGIDKTMQRLSKLNPTPEQLFELEMRADVARDRIRDAADK